MGEKGQPSTLQSPAIVGAVAGNTAGAPPQPGGEKGQGQTGTLADTSLQQELQKESKGQQDLSNVSKNMSATADDMSRKSK